MQQSIELKERQFKVTQSNEFIRNARSQMTAAEMRLFIYVVSQIDLGDTTFKPCEIEVKKFCEICDISPDVQYGTLRSITYKLKSRVYEILGEDNSYTQLGYIRQASFKKGKITVLLDELLAPQLLALKQNFTSFGLVNMLVLKSKYAMTIYQILKSFESIVTWETDLDDLKRKLYAEQYDRYPDFRRKVLEPAIEEINEKTDIKVSYDLQKEGKKVVGIKFIIRENKDVVEQRAAELPKAKKRPKKEPLEEPEINQEKFEYQVIAKVFDLDRKLVKREKDYIDKWTLEFDFEKGIYREAYERCIYNTGKLSFPYINKVLHNWDKAGYKSLEEVKQDGDKFYI